ncbi:VOC family protein [Vallicoccus soli]|uniref:VOC family protein n=1 Tax=Vallicoccus soli TaxID=2339232 RepID=UPI001C49AD3A|nr:VOC family protein [Vallicoccus soli]
MPTFAGVDHVSLTVTDLERSVRFYAEVLDFVQVIDAGYGRVCMHPRTGFVLGLVRHEGAQGTPFTELATGLDHLGLVAASRDELVAWEERLRGAGVPYTPVRDMPLGHHLAFRDPDGIALELYAPNDVMAAALRELRSREVAPEELLAMARQVLGAPPA